MTVCEVGEDGESEGEEEKGRKVADMKYNQFQKECGHLLDPTLADEFALMKSLGLPTLLINSYGDMDDSEVRRREGSVGLMYVGAGGGGRGEEGW